MANYFKWLLFIPILILLLGTSMLLSNEVIIKKQFILLNKHSNALEINDPNIHREFSKRTFNYGEVLKHNRESVYPYFLLGSALLLFILVLPKLTEFSFSPTSGFTLKVLQEVQDSIIEAKASALAIEEDLNKYTRATIIAKSEQEINVSKIKAEIQKLEESRKKLESYSRLLEKTKVKTLN